MLKTDQDLSWIVIVGYHQQKKIDIEIILAELFFFYA